MRLLGASPGKRGGAFLALIRKLILMQTLALDLLAESRYDFREMICCIRKLIT